METTKRYTILEERKSDEGRWYEKSETWIDAATADDALAIFVQRHGEPVARFGKAGARELMLVFYVENGNNPYRLYVEAYDWPERWANPAERFMQMHGF